MPYCDDFWHINAHENILSPACLTVFVKSKTENQLIRFVIACLVADSGAATVGCRGCPDTHKNSSWGVRHPQKLTGISRDLL